MKNNLREQQFFFWLHYNCAPWDSMRLSPDEREWFINRLIQQKEKEREEIQRTR